MTEESIIEEKHKVSIIQQNPNQLGIVWGLKLLKSLYGYALLILIHNYTY